ncbi:gas vesicle protein [Streptomyces radicis]|uniref:Gas vesicle protein n=1 Tax=Streptomyces radicis TaxID=1750517 RepID=A0A3A9WIS6_9ACTN|nr:gas vesicle protein [Streptomyces radicis]RKN09364.1 gas vesicle protein [Streptomyces radicis]RKN23038.1 gas vesicle protein [Streptomyces radicis]
MADQQQRRGGRGSSGPPPVRGPSGAARRACRRLEKLTGHSVDGVSAVHREEDGWRVCVDVLEVPRIPDTTSLMATYEVELDEDGRLRQYRRVRRYRRCATDDYC